MNAVPFRTMKPLANGIANFATRYVCELILIVSLYFSFQYQREYHDFEKIIKSDGHGYYAYLPAVFIYNDYTFSFTHTISDKYENMIMGSGFMNETPDGNVNKYFIGLSLLWLPFFLVAHFLTILLNLSADGYSLLYQLSVLIAANFYLWAGCRFLLKLLSHYPVTKSIAAYIVVLIVFGTNLFCYTTFESCFTHVYSFAAISGFLYFISRFFQTHKRNYLFLSAFVLGIITLLRPTNIVIAILIFFFAGSLSNIIKTIRDQKKDLVFSVVIFLITLSPQILLYYLQSGHLMVWSYGQEGFDFLDPYIYDTLFSYKKGMFVYVPVFLLSLLGISHLHLQNRFQFRTMLLFIFVNTYIISSWWCWWYGDSLGQRSFIDTYAVLGLLLAFAYISLKTPYEKWIYIATGPLFIFYSMMLTYQYRNEIIDRGGMSKQTYWFTFMKTDTSIAGIATFKDLFADVKTANIVNIKSSNNLFVSAESAISDNMLADRFHPQSWEYYNLIRLPENKVAFKCYDGNFMSTRLDNGSVITHSAKELRDWEKFDMIFLKKDSFVLKACNNKYIVREKELLRASAENIADAEIFFLIQK